MIIAYQLNVPLIQIFFRLISPVTSILFLLFQLLAQIFFTLISPVTNIIFLLFQLLAQIFFTLISPVTNIIFLLFQLLAQIFFTLISPVTSILFLPFQLLAQNFFTLMSLVTTILFLPFQLLAQIFRNPFPATNTYDNIAELSQRISQIENLVSRKQKDELSETTNRHKEDYENVGQNDPLSFIGSMDRSFYLMLTATIVMAVAAGITFLWAMQKVNNSTNTSASTPHQNDRVPTNTNRPPSTPSSWQRTPSQDDSRLTCGICYEADRNCLFEPCHHMFACIKCANTWIRTNNNCPMCRRHVARITQVYL